MNAKPNKPKIGQGSLKAFGRQGIKELGNALQALPTSLPMVDEPGQMWSPTPQAISQQTGVSQKVNFSRDNSPKGFDAMNSPQSSEPDIASSQAENPEVAAPDVAPSESILDSLTENAREMSQEQEMERGFEMDP